MSERQVDELLKPVLSSSLGERAKKTLQFVDGERVLDVGCGVGVMAYAIAKERASRTVLGVDVLETSIEIAREKLSLPNVRYIAGNLLDLSLEAESFDCILFLETVEHVDNTGELLREFHRLLKPNGALVVSTPNAVGLQNFFRHAGQNVRKRLEQIKFEKKNAGNQEEHVGSFDVFTLVRLLDRRGFGYESHVFARLSLPLARGFWLDLSFLPVGFLSDTVIVKARKKPLEH